MRPRYNRAGALESVELDGATFVDHIAYNAKGQRALIAYGNGVMTRYAYDPRTFRSRACAPSATRSPMRSPTCQWQRLQDFAYSTTCRATSR